MLERTLEHDFVPGSNLEDEAVAFADWRFLISDPSPARVLCLDRPAPHTRAFLHENVGTVYVAGTDPEPDPPFQALQLFGPEGDGRLPLADGSVDLIVAETRRAVRLVARSGEMTGELARIMAAGGALYMECFGLSRRLEARALQRLAEKGMGCCERYWLTPLRGAMRTAAPLGDAQSSLLLFRNALYGRSRANQLISRLGRSLSQTRFFTRGYPRRGFVVQGSGAAPGPPVYLRRAAQRNGLRLGDHRCVVSARGRYRSNKIVYFLIPRGDDDVEWVVKVSRSPEFSERLDHEDRVLRHLTTRGLLHANSRPEVRFLDSHGGRAILCMRAARGVPFQSVSAGRPNCPWAERAVEVLIGLGETSKKAIAGAALLDALDETYRKFDRIYQLPAAERAVLREMIERLARPGALGFSVLQHGDPGVQNILVSQPSNLVFLDWESSELEGMPLWDLFYFLRTFVNWAEQLRGSADASRNFQANFLSRGRFTPLIVSAVESYCRRLDLDRELVEPLFLTGWMHRCLKESILLPSKAIHRGNYIRVLRKALLPQHRSRFRALWPEREVRFFSPPRKVWS